MLFRSSVVDDGTGGVDATTDGDASASGTETVEASGVEQLNLPGPTGPGWIIEIQGYHYFNKSYEFGGAVHVRSTLLKELERGSVVLPSKSDGTGSREFTMKRLGIGFPILALESGQPTVTQVSNPEFTSTDGNGGLGDGGFGEGYGDGEGDEGGPGGLQNGVGRNGQTSTGESAEEGDEEDEVEPRFFAIKKHSFTVQFVWQENRLTARVKALDEEEEAKAEAAKKAASEAATAAAGDANEIEGS